MKKLTQTGDTIVEVMLAMTVLALVVGSSYAISSRALITAQRSQERIQAIKHAEGQIERLKYLAGLPTPRTAFNNLTHQTIAGVSDLVSAPKCISDTLVTALKTNALCQKDGIYSLAFVDNDPSDGLFKLVVEWDAYRATTATKENVTFYYKVH